MFNFEFTTRPRGTLYYGQYQYCLVFKLAHACFIRHLNHDTIDTAIAWRNIWRSHRPSWMRSVSAEQANDLHRVCDYFLSKTTDYKKVVCSHNIYVYTNHPAEWQDIDRVSANIKVANCSAVDSALPSNVLVRKNPKHSYRSYFRDDYSGDNIELIRRFFLARMDQFDPSPSFRNFLNGKISWINAYHFVDYNDEKLELLIKIVCPRLISKTMPIVAVDK